MNKDKKSAFEDAGSTLSQLLSNARALRAIRHHPQFFCEVETLTKVQDSLSAHWFYLRNQLDKMCLTKKELRLLKNKEQQLARFQPIVKRIDRKKKDR